MTPIEMAVAAIKAMEPPCLGVIMTIPKGKKPRNFPRGETLNEMRRNGVVEVTYNFPDPMKILAWLVNNGLVTIRKDGSTYVVENGKSAALQANKIV